MSNLIIDVSFIMELSTGKESRRQVVPELFLDVVTETISHHRMINSGSATLQSAKDLESR